MTPSESCVLDHRQLVALYVFLCKHETALDPTQSAVLNHISAYLYHTCSVAEMEDVESYYRTIEEES